MDDAQTLRLALDEVEARQLALMAVVKLMVKHHPDREGFQQSGRSDANSLGERMLFAPLPDRMAEVALETYRSLLGIRAKGDGAQTPSS